MAPAGMTRNEGAPAMKGHVTAGTCVEAEKARYEGQSTVSAPKEIVNVLFIIDQLCALGGAERVLLRIVQGLPRDRFAPRVVTFKINEELRLAESMSCPLHVYPLKKTYDWEALEAARQIRQMVRSVNVRITHTFHETADLWGGMIAKMSGCPILVSSRRDMG